MEQVKLPTQFKINIENPLENINRQVLIIYNDPTMSVIIESYADELDVFWCKRLDGKMWDKSYGVNRKEGNMLLAVHSVYMFNPPKGDWDCEENYHA